MAKVQVLDYLTDCLTESLAQAAAEGAHSTGASIKLKRVPDDIAKIGHFNPEQTVGLWVQRTLHGKVGGAFTPSPTQHGGQVVTLFSCITSLLHFCRVMMGRSCCCWV